MNDKDKEREREPLPRVSSWLEVDKISGSRRQWDLLLKVEAVQNADVANDKRL